MWLMRISRATLLRLNYQPRERSSAWIPGAPWWSAWTCRISAAAADCPGLARPHLAFAATQKASCVLVKTSSVQALANAPGLTSRIYK